MRPGKTLQRERKVGGAGLVWARYSDGMRGASRAIGWMVAALALAGCHRARLEAVGPRTVTNQTAFPIALYGEGFEAGQTLKLEGALSREVPIRVVDPRHAYAR